MVAKTLDQAVGELSKAIGILTADVANLREHMLTRDDFPQALDAGLKPLSDALLQQGAQGRAIAERLEDVRTSLRGYTKEADGLRQRLQLIEQHLGLDREIAA